MGLASMPEDFISPEMEHQEAPLHTAPVGAVEVAAASDAEIAPGR